LSETKQSRLTNGKTIDRCGPMRASKECTEACYFAETEKEKCRCRCNGAYHGIGRRNRILLSIAKQDQQKKNS
jgi:hypothetical protein